MIQRLVHHQVVEKKGDEEKLILKSRAGEHSK